MLAGMKSSCIFLCLIIRQRTRTMSMEHVLLIFASFFFFSLKGKISRRVERGEIKEVLKKMIIKITAFLLEGTITVLVLEKIKKTNLLQPMWHTHKHWIN